MTRRTFVLLVCRFVGLMSAIKLVQAEFGLPDIGRVVLPNRYFPTDPAPLWLYASVVLPVVVCVLGIVLGLASNLLARAFPATEEMELQRPRYAILVLVLAFSFLGSCISIANNNLNFYILFGTHPRSGEFFGARYGAGGWWPFVALPFWLVALAWLWDRGAGTRKEPETA